MILVTGATGILGRLFVLRLLQNGHRVRATKRSSSDLDEVKNSFRFYTDNAEKWFEKIEWVEVDFQDIEDISRLLLGVKEVYHCAAEVSFDDDKKKQIFQTNFNLTKELLYACEGTEIEAFLYVSSISVLDSPNEKGLLDEESFYNSKLKHSSYAQSKHFAEMEVQRAGAEGLNILILNPGVIIGTGNWQKSSGKMFELLSQYSYSFDGSTGYVDVRDVVDMGIQLMEKKIFDQRFILVAENLSYLEYANKVRTSLGLKPSKRVPSLVLWFLQILAPFGMIFKKLKLFSKQNIQMLSSQSKYSNEKIKKYINQDFIPIDKSIEFHLKNYLEDKKNKK